MIGVKMNGHNHYRIGSYFLIGLAALFVLAALLTDPQGYLESPILMLSATSFIGGFFLFALGADESINAGLASQLSMQGIPALNHIIRDMGGYGAATFLPPDSEDGRVMQFVPTRPNCRPYLGDGGGFAYHNGSTGTLSPPLTGSILDTLKRDNDLTLPSNYSPLMGAIREVCEDLLSITDRVEIRRTDDKVTFTLHNYLLLPGCASLREVSPESCSLCPCSICSLIACMIAEGLKCEVNLDQVTLDDTGRSPRMDIQYTLTPGTEISG